MRKGVYGRQLGRTTNQRKALFKALVKSLVEKGSIETTLAKAKAVLPLAEKLITKAKKGSLADRRVIFRFLGRRQLVNRLVDEIAPVLRGRKSGYLRVLKLPRRRGDAAIMAQLSFVDSLPSVSKKEKPTKIETKKLKEEAKNDKTN